MIGVNRILKGSSVANILGDSSLSPEHEGDLRRQYVKRALEILQMDVKDKQIFTLDGTE
jgi:hypothetical protein